MFACQLQLHLLGVYVFLMGFEWGTIARVLGVFTTELLEVLTGAGPELPALDPTTTI